MMILTYTEGSTSHSVNVQEVERQHQAPRIIRFQKNKNGVGKIPTSYIFTNLIIMTITAKKSFKEVKADEGMWILNKISRAIAKKFICGLNIDTSQYEEITEEEKIRIEEEENSLDPNNEEDDSIAIN